MTTPLHCEVIVTDSVTTAQCSVPTPEKPANDEAILNQLQASSRIMIQGNWSRSDFQEFDKMESIQFVSVYFSRADVQLQLSKTSVNSVELESTNAQELMLEFGANGADEEGVSTTPGTINFMKLMKNDFKHLPKLLYKYSWESANLEDVELELTDQLKLNEKDYERVVANNIPAVAVGESCTDEVVVCKSGNTASLKPPTVVPDETDGTNDLPLSKAPEKEQVATSSSDTPLGLILGIIAAAVVCIALVAMFVLRRRRATKGNWSQPPTEACLDLSPGEYYPAPEPALKRSAAPLNVIPDAELKDKRVVPATAYHTALLHDEQVFCKCSEPKHRGSTNVRLLTKQSEQLSHITNEHVVSLVGVSKLEMGAFAIVAEYMDEGSLEMVLLDRMSFTLEDRLRMCLEVAQGLAYLHGIQYHVFPFTCSDVLVNGSMKCKINLFKCRNASSKRFAMPVAGFGTGLVPFLAPELVHRDGRQSPDPAACNIYALGMIMGEVATCKRPYESLIQAHGATFTDVMLVSHRQNRGSSMMKPKSIPKDPFENCWPENASQDHRVTQLQSLIKSCLSSKDKRRPSAPAVVKALSKLLE